jgi:ribosomal protein S4
LHRIGFVPTLTLARFLIQQGCILVNEQVVADVRYCVRVGECVRLDLVRYQAH